MRRISIPILAAVLALTTAVTLLGVARAMTTNAAGERPSGPNRTLAYDFYTVVNDALRTGDAAPVLALLAPDFAELGSGVVTSAASGRDEFGRRLAALRASYPDLRLVVEDLLMRRDTVVAHLRVLGGTDPNLLGARLPDMTAPWASVEVLRVTGGRIAERLSDGAVAPLVQPLWHEPMNGSPVAADIGLSRLTLAPGAITPDLSPPGPTLIAVETGTLAVLVHDPRAPNPETVARASNRSATSPVREVVLRPGERRVLPADAPYALRNDGATPAVALGVALFRPTYAARHHPFVPASVERSAAFFVPSVAPTAPSVALAAPSAPGVTIDHLVDGPTNLLGLGPIGVTTWRVTLAPGTTMSLPATAYWTLLAVESGTADVAITDGQARIRSSLGGRLVPVREDHDPTIGVSAGLQTGGAALLHPNNLGTLCNPDRRPLVALLVGVAAGEPDETV